MTGGVFADALAEENTRLVEAPSTATHMVFDVAALGPAGGRKSEQASIVVAAVAPVRPADGQLRVTANFVALPAGATLILPDVSPYAEVLIDGAPVAKEAQSARVPRRHRTR